MIYSPTRFNCGDRFFVWASAHAFRQLGLLSLSSPTQQRSEFSAWENCKIFSGECLREGLLWSLVLNECKVVEGGREGTGLLVTSLVGSFLGDFMLGRGSGGLTVTFWGGGRNSGLSFFTRVSPSFTSLTSDFIWYLLGERCAFKLDALWTLYIFSAVSASSKPSRGSS